MSGITQPALERRVYLNVAELNVIYRLVDDRIDSIGTKCSADRTRYIVDPFFDRLKQKLNRALNPQRRKRG